MKNVTITLPEDVAKWARVWAAQHERSLSRMIAEMLGLQMQREEGYETAMNSFLSREPKRLKSRGTAYPSRDELHDRDTFR
ncbi:MAG: CopG family transcriptional regulator [Kiritimatiellae bacterium]|nr:CopG family transcriptional regulator [Kiritimatiellia bacterium]